MSDTAPPTPTKPVPGEFDPAALRPTLPPPVEPLFTGRTERDVVDYLKAWVRREMALAALGLDEAARVGENP
jgi:hypothetical protein